MKNFLCFFNLAKGWCNNHLLSSSVFPFFFEVCYEYQFQDYSPYFKALEAVNILPPVSSGSLFASKFIEFFFVIGIVTLTTFVIYNGVNLLLGLHRPDWGLSDIILSPYYLLFGDSPSPIRPELEILIKPTLIKDAMYSTFWKSVDVTTNILFSYTRCFTQPGSSFMSRMSDAAADAATSSFIPIISDAPINLSSMPVIYKVYVYPQVVHTFTVITNGGTEFTCNGFEQLPAILLYEYSVASLSSYLLQLPYY